MHFLASCLILIVKPKSNLNTTWIVFVWILKQLLEVVWICPHEHRKTCHLHPYKPKHTEAQMQAHSGMIAQITQTAEFLLQMTACSLICWPLNEARTVPGGGRARERGEEECTDHDSCEQTDSFATVGVRNHVSIADGQESDGDKPHGSQKVTGHVLGIMIPKGK